MGAWARRCGCIAVWAWVWPCLRGCMCGYPYGCAGVRYQLLPSLLSEPQCVCRGPLRVRRARSVALRTRTRLYIANASRACVSDVALLCFHPCIGLNARVRAVCTPARDVSSHTRVLFATCTFRFTVHLVTSEPYQAHASNTAPLTVSRERQGRVPRSATSRSSQFTVRPIRCHVIPCLSTRHQAAPTRAAQSLTSGTRRAHEYRMLHSLVFRLNVGPNARMRAVLIPARDARTDTNALFTMCTHPVGNIDEAPLHWSANHAKHTRHTEQREVGRVICAMVLFFCCAVLRCRSF